MFLTLRELRKGGFEVECERVDNPGAMAAALERDGWDIILSDFAMPHFNGLEALAMLRQKGLDLPFILMSGTVGEDVAVSAMKMGASDYLMKGNLTRLVPSIERELGEAAGRRAGFI